MTVDGKPRRKTGRSAAFLLLKPTGTLTAERDPRVGRQFTIVFQPNCLELIPVGRLDYNTEGLLLMTNDGELKRQLELPKTGVRRVYRARAFGTVSQQDLEALSEGITIDGMHYGSIDANMERRTWRNCWIRNDPYRGEEPRSPPRP